MSNTVADAIAGFILLAWLISYTTATVLLVRRHKKIKDVTVKNAKGLMGVFTRPKKARQHITFIIPFRTDHGQRERVWQWLFQYYQSFFPDAEFIIATDHGSPFCKTAAVNRGIDRASGDIIVMMDADCFIEPFVIRTAVRRIREARARKERLWFIPYRRFYRLTEAFTDDLLKTRPSNPPMLGDPPDKDDYIPRTPGSVSAGHWYGALIQIYPVEALKLVGGGMDERFAGWGGEDSSFMHAMDTLYSKHKTLNDPVYHFWHATIPGLWQGTRQWQGQEKPEINDPLSSEYNRAIGDRRLMRKLVQGARG